jgi:radical SAM superfamily enzyme YgiQ (UPF0313 family)
MLKLLLISPRNSTVGTTKGRQLAHIGLPIVAAWTPPEWEVEIIDDVSQDVDFEANVDLVGISIFTAQAVRGYELADRFRKRGIKVILGGMHASSLPEEAIHHADAVVIGEAEGVWPVVLEDWKKNQLKRFYRNEQMFKDLSYYRPPRRELLKTSVAFGMTPVQTTRGCPYRCNFCTVHMFYGGKYRYRPVDDVINELRSIDSKHVLFIDDHIMGNPKYAKELFEKMIPLKKRWGGQSTLLVARDKDLIRLAAKSGAFSMFIGLESVIQETLAEANKTFNKTKDYIKLLKTYHEHGIGVVAGTIFGFDTDDKGVFEKTAAFYDMAGVAVPNYGILTPFPGTGQYEMMERQGRILTKDWSLYTGSHVVFRPKNMTPSELLDGKNWAAQQTYGLKSIARRLRENWRTPLFYTATNLSYKYNVDTNFPKGFADRIPGQELQAFLAGF